MTTPLTENQILAKLRDEWRDRETLIAFYKLYQVLERVEQALYVCYGTQRRVRHPAVMLRILERRARLREALGLLNDAEMRGKHHVSCEQIHF